MWKAGPRPPVVALLRWSRECVGSENRVGFGADKRVWEQRAKDVKDAAPGCKQGRSKWRPNSRERAEKSTRDEAMRKKRTRMRQDAEVQPSLAWKWSSRFLESPPAQSPLSATHSRPFARGPPQLAVGQWGQAACRAPGLALADGAAPLLRSTCTATAHKVRSTSHAQQALGACGTVLGAASGLAPRINAGRLARLAGSAALKRRLHRTRSLWGRG